MAFGINKLQKVSVAQESTFGASLSSGDYSGGVLVRPLEAGDLSQFVREVIADSAIRRDFSDSGLPAAAGLAKGKVSLKVRLAGATRTGGAITADGLSSLLDWAIGDRRAPGNSVTDSGSTASVIQCAGHSYQVGDVVKIGTECRRVSARTTDSFTVSPPLSSAPASGAEIVGCESFTAASGTAQPSLGLGIELTGDSEMTFRAAGCAATGLTLGEIAPGTQLALTLELSISDYARASVTHATTETPNAPVVASVSAVSWAQTDSTGALFAPVLASATAGLGVNNLLVAGMASNAVGGNVGVVPDIVDGEVGKVKILHSPADGTFAKTEGLIGSSFSAVLQVGTAEGGIIGIAYPECSFTQFPTVSDASGVKALEYGFKAAAGVLFRG